MYMYIYYISKYLKYLTSNSSTLNIYVYMATYICVYAQYLYAGVWICKSSIKKSTITIQV